MVGAIHPEDDCLQKSTSSDVNEEAKHQRSAFQLNLTVIISSDGSPLVHCEGTGVGRAAVRLSAVLPMATGHGGSSRCQGVGRREKHYRLTTGR